MRITHGIENPTVEYAAEELRRYLQMMCEDIGVSDVSINLTVDESLADDPFIDDVMDIDIRNGSGYTACGDSVSRHGTRMDVREARHPQKCRKN